MAHKYKVVFKNGKAYHRMPSGKLMKGKYHKSNSGVPVGYKHDWKYRGQWVEKKIAPKLWKFRFKATKPRSGSSKGGLPIGGSVAWAIKGVQVAKKTGGRKYITDFKGVKKLIKTKIRGKKRRYYG
jgi:hypothetical protein